MQTVQYHDPVILRMTPASGETPVLASVTLCYGPITIRCKLVTRNNNIYLNFPGNKDTDDKWWDHAYIHDNNVLHSATELAKQHYQEHHRDHYLNRMGMAVAA